MADRKTKETELTPREAIAQFAKSVKENANDAHARFNLGSAYYAAGDLDAAFKEFQAVIAISPSLDHAHYYLGVIYAARGDKASARQELEKVINGGGHFMLKNQARIRLQALNKT